MRIYNFYDFILVTEPKKRASDLRAVFRTLVRTFTGADFLSTKMHVMGYFALIHRFTASILAAGKILSSSGIVVIGEPIAIGIAAKILRAKTVIIPYSPIYRYLEKDAEVVCSRSTPNKILCIPTEKVIQRSKTIWRTLKSLTCYTVEASECIDKFS